MTTRTELEAEREFLLTSLRDLDAELAAGDLTEADHRELRDRYTARAAEVLAALEAGVESPASAEAAEDGRTGRKLAAAALVLVLALAAGMAVASSSGDRLAGDQATGEITQGVTGKLARARQLIGAGKVSEAVKVYDDVLAEDPQQPEALAYRGWIVHLAGLSDKGLEYVERAVEADPGYADAHFFRGMILWRAKGDAAAAVSEFRLFLDSDPPPDMVGLVNENLARAEAEAAAAAAPSSTTP